MNPERADARMGIDHEDEIVLRSKELAIELAETRRLLWLVIEKYEPGMQASVKLSDLLPGYDLESYEPAQQPGTVIITARTK